MKDDWRFPDTCIHAAPATLLEPERIFPSEFECDMWHRVGSGLGRDLPKDDVVFNYSAINNHAHPLLKEGHRRSIPFEGAIEMRFIPSRDIARPDNSQSYTGWTLVRITMGGSKEP